MATNPSVLLKKNHLSLTSCRKDILSALLDVTGTISYTDLTDLLGNRYNRATVYRTLKVLEKKGIIRKITIDRRQVLYEVQKSQRDLKMHAHFFCRKCGNLICIEEPVEIPVQIPENFSTEDAEIVVKGLCVSCKE